MSLKVGDVFEIDYFRENYKASSRGQMPGRVVVCQPGDVCKIERIDYAAQAIIHNNPRSIPTPEGATVYTINITKNVNFLYVGDLPVKKKLPLGKVLYE